VTGVTVLGFGPAGASAAITAHDAGARVTVLEKLPYAAGGCGSISGHLTEHGGGLADAIVFGRIAGEQAATAS
jgi:succinate dehydrogenase/fumarate reductase flavoprotein subunit